MIEVDGCGPVPCPIMLVGEAPGADEAREGRPFVGRAGQEQDRHLRRNGLHRSQIYMTNLRKTYIPGNPPPDPADIKRWGPRLEQEIARVRPKFVIAVGAHSIRYFLGQSASLEAVHGIPHRPLGRTFTVLPCYHPASYFYATELLQFIVYDYSRAAAAIRGEIPLDGPSDCCPEPKYIGGGAAEVVRHLEGDAFALDTEGEPGDVWSWQISGRPGSAVVVRGDRAAIRTLLGRCRGKTLIGHNLLYEVEMFRSLGVDLLDPDLGLRLFDTQMAAYLMCIEPQGLKDLARRHLGMEMESYREVVGAAGRDKQLEYLERVVEHKWDPPQERAVVSNDGTARVYRPKAIARIAESILIDCYSGKTTADGPTDPYKRWKAADPIQRRMVEREIGPMPVGSLHDVPLSRAIYYAGRDVDATIRLYPIMCRMLESQGLMDLFCMKMRMYPAAAEMKINGILAKRSHFERLLDRMGEEMDRLRDRISREFLGGRPFNPASSLQVVNLMNGQRVEGVKRTATGRVSTSKKSIEHLRFEHRAIDMVEQWRERQKVRDSFARPILERFPEGAETARISGDLKLTRVSSGRFSMANPNLLAIPVRNELGLEVRRGFVAEEGYVLGTWDLDQIEMRIMADESGDERLKALFADGKIDVHTSTASKIFGIPYDQVDKMRHRYPAKRAGFGIITGIQGQGLLDQLRMAGCQGWDLERCDRLIREWLRLYSNVPRYMEWCAAECEKAGGVIRDRWGMPRYLPAIFSSNRWERLEARRQAHSHRIQGGAQGLIQTSMGWIWTTLKPYGTAVRWILQIHDEIILEVARGLEEEVDSIVIEGLTRHNGAALSVPVKSKGSYGHSWGDLEK